MRLSMVDARGGEFYRIILVSSGFVRDDDGKRVPRYRADRDRALDAIEVAMARGDEPGEVALLEGTFNGRQARLVVQRGRRLR